MTLPNQLFLFSPEGTLTTSPFRGVVSAEGGCRGEHDETDRERCQCSVPYADDIYPYDCVRCGGFIE